MKSQVQGLSLALAALLSVSGEALAGGGIPTPPPPGPGQAQIYIFRSQDGALGGRGSTFSVDNVNVVTVGYPGCTTFAAPAGYHTLRQKWPLDVSFGSVDSQVVNWEAGKAYAYMQGTRQESWADFRTKVLPVDAAVIQLEAPICRYAEPKNLDKLRPGVAPKGMGVVISKPVDELPSKETTTPN